MLLFKSYNRYIKLLDLTYQSDVNIQSLHHRNVGKGDSYIICTIRLGASEMADYTPDGLPVVTKETVTSLAGIVQRELHSYVCDAGMLRQIETENPLVYRIIESLKKRCDNERYRAYAFGMYFTYELLRRQSAANKLKSEVKE